MFRPFVVSEAEGLVILYVLMTKSVDLLISMLRKNILILIFFHASLGPLYAKLFVAVFTSLKSSDTQKCIHELKLGITKI